MCRRGAIWGSQSRCKFRATPSPPHPGPRLAPQPHSSVAIRKIPLSLESTARCPGPPSPWTRCPLGPATVRSSLHLGSGPPSWCSRGTAAPPGSQRRPLPCRSRCHLLPKAVLPSCPRPRRTHPRPQPRDPGGTHASLSLVPLTPYTARVSCSPSRPRPPCHHQVPCSDADEEGAPTLTAPSPSWLRPLGPTAARQPDLSRALTWSQQAAAAPRTKSLNLSLAHKGSLVYPLQVTPPPQILPVATWASFSPLPLSSPGFRRGSGHSFRSSWPGKPYSSLISHPHLNPNSSDGS